MITIPASPASDSLGIVATQSTGINVTRYSLAMTRDFATRAAAAEAHGWPGLGGPGQGPARLAPFQAVAPAGARDWPATVARRGGPVWAPPGPGPPGRAAAPHTTT